MKTLPHIVETTLFDHAAIRGFGRCNGMFAASYFRHTWPDGLCDVAWLPAFEEPTARCTEN